ncbi:MAG: DNA polymerase III subunit delta [Bdellovibrionota bacterium]
MSVSPMYVAVEPEAFQLRQFLDKLRGTLFPQGKDPESEHRIHITGSNASLSDVIDRANTFSMFAPKQLIICELSKAPTEKQEQQLLNYAENPSEQNTLVVILSKLDKRKKLYKSLKKQNALLELPKPKAYEMPGWATRICHERGWKISSRAAALLSEHIGDDLSRMASELEKLSLYVHPKQEIAEKDVLEMTVKTSGDHVFAFTDQVMEKKKKAALTSLHYLLASGTPALVLMGMLARHLRILIQTFEAIERKVPKAAMAQDIGVPPFTLARYETQCRGLRKKDCHRFLSRLQKLDRDLKSTGISPNLLIEQTVRSMAS